MEEYGNDIRADLYLGDSLNQLRNIADNSVDLIVASPPYADQRQKTYGGIPIKEYVNWFLPISKELLRVLKPTGTFILNIKEKVQNGERNTYVLELIIEMKKQGWLWTEEFIWQKKMLFWKVAQSVQRCLGTSFAIQQMKSFNMYQKSVMVPTGEWAKTRLKKLSDTDKIRDYGKRYHKYCRTKNE